MDFSQWNWNPRYDLDLLQRCLTIIAHSILYRLVLGPILKFIWLDWLVGTPLDFITILLLIGALCKSSIQLNPKGKSVLITGCDTGFGFELAKHLHSLQCKVYAGCLFKDGDGGKELAELGIDVIQLDVTKEEEWDLAIEHIQQTSKQLWGLVNNAGWSTFGDFEWVQMDTYRRIVEINIFGLLQALKKAAPLVRKGKGRIVTVTSGLARSPAASRSSYIITKYGGMGLMECVRYELKRFGVKVSMIEPGNFLAATKLFNQSIIGKQADAMWDKMPEEVKNAYGESYFRNKVGNMDKYFHIGFKTVTPVIESYTNALLDVFPQVRYQPMGLFWKVRTFVYTHLPESIFDWIYM